MADLGCRSNRWEQCPPPPRTHTHACVRTATAQPPSAHTASDAAQWLEAPHRLTHPHLAARMSALPVDDRHWLRAPLVGQARAGETGFRVAGVAPGGPAASAGLANDEIIVRVGAMNGFVAIGQSLVRVLEAVANQGHVATFIVAAAADIEGRCPRADSDSESDSDDSDEDAALASTTEVSLATVAADAVANTNAGQAKGAAASLLAAAAEGGRSAGFVPPKPPSCSSTRVRELERTLKGMVLVTGTILREVSFGTSSGKALSSRRCDLL